MKIELAVEVKAQVIQDRFRGNNGVPYRRKINRRVRRMLSSCEMEKFSFAVFYDKACVKEKFRYDVITTE